MWLENLRELRAAKGNPPYKQIAEKSSVPERTVTRIFSGETGSPSMETLRKIVVKALGGSLDDIFADTNVVVGRMDLAELQAEVDRLNGEIERLNGVVAVYAKDVEDLVAENDILRLKLEHKEELLALHDYYIKKASE